jgi:hypothetical protein
MTRTDFDHLRKSVDAWSPDQLRRLIRALESRVAASAKRPATTETPAKAKAKRDAAKTAKPMTNEEFHRHLMEIGLIRQLPDTDADCDDPDDEPITIKRLSENGWNPLVFKGFRCPKRRSRMVSK